MRTRAYRSHRNHPALPAKWFTAYNVLTSATGLFATVIPAKLSLPRNLTPASGCRAHTSLPYASGAVVLSTLGVHRSPPRERDDRDSPLSVGQDGENIGLILVSEKQKYFFKGGLTEGSINRADDLPVGQNQWVIAAAIGADQTRASGSCPDPSLPQLFMAELRGF